MLRNSSLTNLNPFSPLSTLPVIPTSAPFTEEQRLWLNGYIAGLISEDSTSPAITKIPKLRIPVLYASQSGNSESLAEDFADQLSASGFDAPCLSTEDHAEIDLTSEKHLLLISSTWGEGDPPDNAIEFWENLKSDDHPSLQNLNFSVLGLGDSNYLDFCAQAKAFDARLEALGANRIATRVDCDTDFEEPAAEWFESVNELLKEQVGVTEDSTNTEQKAPPSKAESGYSKKKPFHAILKANLELNSADSARDTRHFEFDLTGSGLNYEVGDVLGVYPKNDPAMADELIEILNFDPSAKVITPDKQEKPLRDALIEDFDIRTLSAKMMTDWSARSSSEELAQLLESDDRKSLENYIWGRELIDLAIDHPATFTEAPEFVTMLRKLGARLYSICSSPKAHPDEVHLTVAKVTYESHGRQRGGVCSTYLSDRVNSGETTPIFFQPAAHFKLPTDLSTDVIMCGPGTGIAPFRAFIEEREATNAEGKNWLFFGNPHEETDFLYREQLQAQSEAGVLTNLDLAWSRDGEEKVYVQDKMRENGADLWKWFQGGAHFYICGDAKRMAKDVDAVLHGIAEEHGGLSEEAAKDYINQLKKEKRYQRDVY